MRGRVRYIFAKTTNNDHSQKPRRQNILPLPSSSNKIKQSVLNIVEHPVNRLEFHEGMVPRIHENKLYKR